MNELSNPLHWFLEDIFCSNIMKEFDATLQHNPFFRTHVVAMPAETFSDSMQFFPPMHATGRLLYHFLGDLNRCHIIIFSGVHISGCNIRATLWFYWFFSQYLNMNRYNNLNWWISAKCHCSEVRTPSQPFHSAYAFGSEPYCTRRKQTNKHHQALLPLLSKAVLNDSR